MVTVFFLFSLLQVFTVTFIFFFFRISFFFITNATVVLFVLVCGTAYFFLILRNTNTPSVGFKPTVIDSHFYSPNFETTLEFFSSAERKKIILCF